MIFFIRCWIWFANILLRILHPYSTRILAYYCLLWWCLCLVLVSVWWWLHRKSLGVFTLLQSFGKVWQGSVLLCMSGSTATLVIWDVIFYPTTTDSQDLSVHKVQVIIAEVSRDQAGDVWVVRVRYVRGHCKDREKWKLALNFTVRETIRSGADQGE